MANTFPSYPPPDDKSDSPATTKTDESKKVEDGTSSNESTPLAPRTSKTVTKTKPSTDKE